MNKYCKEFLELMDQAIQVREKISKEDSLKIIVIAEEGRNLAEKIHLIAKKSLENFNNLSKEDLIYGIEKSGKMKFKIKFLKEELKKILNKYEMIIH